MQITFISENNEIISGLVHDVAPMPLNQAGVLATLLAVNGVLSVNDAANAVGLSADDLVNEAQAWAVAQENAG